MSTEHVAQSCTHSWGDLRKCLVPGIEGMALSSGGCCLVSVIVDEDGPHHHIHRDHGKTEACVCWEGCGPTEKAVSRSLGWGLSLSVACPLLHTHP